MPNYGITVSDVMNAIRENRNAFRYWMRKEFPTIAQNHADNIRDLRIMLLSVRFPNNSFPAFAFGEGFTPFIVTTQDNDNDNVSDNDRRAITDAIADSIAEADKIAEMVNA